MASPDGSRIFVNAKNAARVVVINTAMMRVEKILEVSRLDQGPRRDAAAEVDVGILLGDVVMAHRPLLEEAGIRVVVEVGDDGEGQRGEPFLLGARG